MPGDVMGTDSTDTEWRWCGKVMMTAARDIMHAGAECIGEHETLAQAARRMRDLGVGALPVCGDDDRLHGIITDRDIVIKCVAAGGDPATVTAGDLAQGKPFTIDDQRVTGLGPQHLAWAAGWFPARCCGRGRRCHDRTSLMAGQAGLPARDCHALPSGTGMAARPYGTVLRDLWSGSAPDRRGGLAADGGLVAVVGRDQEACLVVDGRSSRVQGGAAGMVVVAAQQQVHRVRTARHRRHDNRDHRAGRAAAGPVGRRQPPAQRVQIIVQPGQVTIATVREPALHDISIATVRYLPVGPQVPDGRPANCVTTPA